MTAMRTLSVAMLRGFVRDKMALFFVILFPLMFLFLFGGIFSDDGQSKSSLVEVGDVALLDHMPAGERAAFGQAFEVEHSHDRAAAIEQVRQGEAGIAVKLGAHRLEQAVDERHGQRAPFHDRLRLNAVRGLQIE